MAKQAGGENITSEPVFADQELPPETDADSPGLPPAPDDNFGIFDETDNPNIPVMDDSDSMQPAAGRFGADLLFKANQYGISEEQARSYGSPELLEHTLGMIDQNIMAAQQQQMGGAWGPQGVPAQQDQPLNPPPAGQSTQDTVSDELRYDLDISADADLDAGVVDQLKSMNQHYADRLSKMREDQAAMVSYLREVESRRYSAEFDDAIATLGDDWKPVFGTPDSRAPGSPQHRNFLSAAQLVDSMANASPNATMQSLVAIAAGAAFPEHKDRLYRNGLTAKAKRQTATRMGRPSATQGPTLSPDQRAVMAATRKMRELGL